MEGNLNNVESTPTPTHKIMEFEKMEELLVNMVNSPENLKEGYKTISNFETSRNFYMNMLKIIFVSEHNEKVKKLACSTLKIFLKKNWSDDNYITNEERMVLLNITNRQW